MRKCAELLDSEEKRQTMGRKAIEKVERDFSPTKIGGELYNFYLDSLELKELSLAPTTRDVRALFSITFLTRSISIIVQTVSPIVLVSILGTPATMVGWMIAGFWIANAIGPVIAAGVNKGQTILSARRVCCSRVGVFQHHFDSQRFGIFSLHNSQRSWVIHRAGVLDSDNARRLSWK